MHFAILNDHLQCSYMHCSFVTCRFNAEIVPVPTSIKDANGNVSKVVIERDDGIRASTDSAALAKLKVLTNA
jgi:hypothetical protein